MQTEAFRAVEALAADQDFRVVPGHAQAPKLYQSGMPADGG